MSRRAADRVLAAFDPFIGPTAAWTAAVVVLVAPVVAVLCLTIWRMPYPISEAVAIFEDVERNPPARFLTPESWYYRPLFYVTLSAIWHHAGDLEARLAFVKLLHIIPICLLVAVFLRHVRPRTAIDAAAAIVALAVMIGSPGFRDNLEIPLSYTIVAMPLALTVWLLLNGRRRRWSDVSIVALTLVAMGFKEQGLAIVPLVVVAWWTRAPGSSRGLAAILATLAVAYVAGRLLGRTDFPVFEQAVGLGFRELEPPEAAARFGAFPYPVYVYSAAATISNVLLSEPTRGVFSFVWSVIHREVELWQLIHVGSSLALTALIVSWGVEAVRSGEHRTWSPAARDFIALLVMLLAAAVLSFSYSRDRLGGMVVPFYALAAFGAVRAIGRDAVRTQGTPRAVAVLAVIVLALAWSIRAIGTIEHTRMTSWRNHLEWLTELPARRAEFADRPVYLRILESMIEQGTATGVPRPTPYPPAIAGLFGVPPRASAAPAHTLAQAVERGDVNGAYEFIRDGHDPNGLITVSHPILSGGQPVRVSPLVWAVALRERRIVSMLIAFGARAERPADTRAACLAEAVGDRELSSFLKRYAPDAASGQCRAEALNQRPLVWILESP